MKTISLEEALRQLDAKQEAIDRLESSLQEIVRWADASPVDVFPAMTPESWDALHQWMEGCPVSLSRLSADAMRHVLTGVRGIAASALESGNAPSMTSC